MGELDFDSDGVAEAVSWDHSGVIEVTAHSVDHDGDHDKVAVDNEALAPGDPPIGTEWLGAPGFFLLPSGRRVLVGEREETWVTLELDAGVRVVVDFDQPESVYLSLHRARTSIDGPPATRPYNSEATVGFSGSTAMLEIRDIPSTLHQRSCESCSPDDRSRFAADVPFDLLTAYVDLLSGLCVDTRHWFVPASGARLWRGRIDRTRRALIELLAEDNLLWDATAEVVDRVDLGFDPNASQSPEES